MNNFTNAKVLLVDDDEEARFALQSIVSSEGYSVLTAKDGVEAIEVAEQELPDVIIMDVNMPRMNGFQAAQAMKSDSQLQYAAVLLLTSRDDPEDIVFGLEQGADDYLRKPYNKEELLARLRSALRSREIYRALWQKSSEVSNIRATPESGQSFAGIVGESPAMQEIFSLIEKVKDADAPVLILGESGSGKELIAKSLHEQSIRREKPFVVQNCAALNEQLLESELFGHVKGAFTGAVRTKPGLFQVADGGTFFLDELGEMSQSLQVKLLRVLQDGTFIPVGGTEVKKVSVRVVAATNRNVAEMVEAGTFREDLYYRLNVVTISLPPLRERLDDIPLLARFFLKAVCTRQSIVEKHFSAQALDKLKQYDWPGNIRQLQNEIERVCLLSGAALEIGESDLSSHIVAGQTKVRSQVDVQGRNLKSAIEALESTMIAAALDRLANNKSEAARELGISRSSLISKVKQYQLE